MHSAVQVLRYVNLVAYVALGVVTFVLWLRRRDRPTRWAAIAFGSLGLLELLGLIPNHHGNFVEQANVRIVIATLVLFPYLLFRFTNAFRRPSLKLANGLFILSAILVVWTFALPRIPTANEHRSTGFQVWITVFFIHWTVLSIVSAWSLWTAGRAQPTVARRRMQSLALAAAFITFALLLALPRSNQDSWLSLASQCVALISVIAFFLAFAPPQVLRILWRAPEQRRMQQAIASLLAFAKSQEEVAGGCSSRPRRSSVHARSRSATRRAGSSPPGMSPPRRSPPSGTVSRRRCGKTRESSTSPSRTEARSSSGRRRMRPFFGEEELRLLQTLGALVGLALDRVRLFQAEHEARVALERADR